MLRESQTARTVQILTSLSACRHRASQSHTPARRRNSTTLTLVLRPAFGELHAISQNGVAESSPAQTESLKTLLSWRRDSDTSGPKRFLIEVGEMTNQNPAVMANPRNRIWAHTPCLCTVPEGEEYCGPSCRGAAREDAKIACQCDHTGCSRTIRPFPAYSVDLQGT